MAGDEIVADWLGDTQSSRVLTTAAVQRFCTGPVRFRNIVFFNNDHTDSAYVGKYYATTAEFGAKAHVLYPKTSLKFEFLDLYEMAFMTYINVVYVHWIGSNKY